MIPLLRRRSEASAMLDRGEASDDGTAKLQRGVAHGVVAALCWGSWADTFRSVKKFRRELFCWDCAIGTFLAPLDYAYTMGSGGQDHPGFLVQVRTADAIEYRLGDPGWRDLRPRGPAARRRNRHGRARDRVPGCGRDRHGCGGSVSIRAAGGGSGNVAQEHRHLLSGGLMGLCTPLSTRSFTHGNLLLRYGLTVFVTLGALLSCSIWNVYFMRKPIVGAPVGSSGFFAGPVSGHSLGLLGGAIWATGMVFPLVAPSFTGMAISDAIGQPPMVAALWGSFAWKGFLGVNRRATTYLALMFIFYVVAILLVARANTSASLLAVRIE
jgi:hypothetical protein